MRERCRSRSADGPICHCAGYSQRCYCRTSNRTNACRTPVTSPLRSTRNRSNVVAIPSKSKTVRNSARREDPSITSTEGSTVCRMDDECGIETTTPPDPVLSPDTTRIVENAEKMLNDVEKLVIDFEMKAPTPLIKPSSSFSYDYLSSDEEDRLRIRELVAGRLNSDSSNERKARNSNNRVNPAQKRHTEAITSKVKEFLAMEEKRRSQMEIPPSQSRISVQVGPSVNIEREMRIQKLSSLNVTPRSSYSQTPAKNTKVFVLRHETMKRADSSAAGPTRRKTVKSVTMTSRSCSRSPISARSTESRRNDENLKKAREEYLRLKNEFQDEDCIKECRKIVEEDIGIQNSSRDPEDEICFEENLKPTRTIRAEIEESREPEEIGVIDDTVDKFIKNLMLDSFSEEIRKIRISENEESNTIIDTARMFSHEAKSISKNTEADKAPERKLPKNVSKSKSVEPQDGLYRKIEIKPGDVSGKSDSVELAARLITVNNRFAKVLRKYEPNYRLASKSNISVSMDTSVADDCILDDDFDFDLHQTDLSGLDKLLTSLDDTIDNLTRRSGEISHAVTKCHIKLLESTMRNENRNRGGGEIILESIGPKNIESTHDAVDDNVDKSTKSFTSFDLTSVGSSASLRKQITETDQIKSSNETEINSEKRSQPRSFELELEAERDTNDCQSENVDEGAAVSDGSTAALVQADVEKSHEEKTINENLIRESKSFVIEEKHKSLVSLNSDEEQLSSKIYSNTNSNEVESVRNGDSKIVVSSEKSNNESQKEKAIIDSDANNEIKKIPEIQVLDSVNTPRETSISEVSASSGKTVNSFFKAQSINESCKTNDERIEITSKSSSIVSSLSGDWTKRTTSTPKFNKEEEPPIPKVPVGKVDIEEAKKREPREKFKQIEIVKPDVVVTSEDESKSVAYQGFDEDAQIYRPWEENQYRTLSSIYEVTETSSKNASKTDDSCSSDNNSLRDCASIPSYVASLESINQETWNPRAGRENAKILEYLDKYALPNREIYRTPKEEKVNHFRGNFSEASAAELENRQTASDLEGEVFSMTLSEGELYAVTSSSLSIGEVRTNSAKRVKSKDLFKSDTDILPNGSVHSISKSSGEISDEKLTILDTYVSS